MFALPSLLTASRTAAIALAASSAILAGAGPKTDFDFSIRFGDRDHRGPWHRPPVVVQPPVIVRPAPVVVHRPAETAPTTLSIEAFQTGDTILIVARGENPWAGFATSLEHTVRYGRTIVTLHNIAPQFCAPAAQVCTPFALTGSIDRCERLREITVRVAGSERCVPVVQVGDIPRSW